MYSFVSEEAVGFETDGHVGDVWILYRLNSQSCLIIGAFESEDAAFAYTKRNGPIEQSSWTGPRPGQRYWQYTTSKFTYLIENHRLRHCPQAHQDEDPGLRIASD